ncbi:hypothetical protein LMH87_004038 [Akanthomyces muscarius]|uniref:Uncharacterized protein n=1 Tax=Akanthomyces muscarius TaxID=2231603 RepID=A0A9W8UF91_AKAMU|nr:hypothetical protein LMH87_004038 [Akanthomyces muscarius]KAJ4145182.1 hypothetical protein LMH87_004038 [Akanthomyces muscarius]
MSLIGRQRKWRLGRSANSDGVGVASLVGRRRKWQQIPSSIEFLVLRHYLPVDFCREEDVLNQVCQNTLSELLRQTVEFDSPQSEMTYFVSLEPLEAAVANTACSLDSTQPASSSRLTPDQPSLPTIYAQKRRKRTGTLFCVAPRRFVGSPERLFC